MSASNHQASSKGPLIIVGVVVVVIGTLVSFGLVILMFGWVSGHEFSPYTLQYRTYSYWRIPVIHVQVMPLSSLPDSDPTLTFLKKKKLFRPTPDKTQRWDLVDYSTTSAFLKPGDASVLFAYFDAVDESGNNYWIQWSQSNPDLAKQFWPAVLKLAREDRYYLLPPLFDEALAAKPATFKKHLKDLLAAQYERVAGIRGESDNSSKASQ